MRVSLGCRLRYSFPQPTPLIALLNVHYSRFGDLERADYLVTSPSVPLESYRDGFGNWCTRLLAPAGDFSLLSFVEGLSAQARVKENIDYMRPSTEDVTAGIREHAVEIKVSQIRLDAMVSLLSAVERSPHALRVKRLQVKRRFSDPDLLDVTFVVARYEEV